MSEERWRTENIKLYLKLFRTTKQLNFQAYQWKQENRYLDKRIILRVLFLGNYSAVVMQNLPNYFWWCLHLIFSCFLSRCPTLSIAKVLEKKLKITWQNNAHNTRSHLESTIGHSSPTKVQWWDIKVISFQYSLKCLIRNLFAKSFVVFITFINLRIISATQVLLKLFTSKWLMCSDVNYSVSTWD